MKQILTLALGFSFAAHAGMTTGNVLACAVNDGRELTIDAVKNKKKKIVYEAALTANGAKAEIETSIYKMYLSHQGTGPEAVVYINSALVLEIKMPETTKPEPRGVLEISGETEAREVVCARGPAYN